MEHTYEQEPLCAWEGLETKELEVLMEEFYQKIPSEELEDFLNLRMMAFLGEGGLNQSMVNLLGPFWERFLFAFSKITAGYSGTRLISGGMEEIFKHMVGQECWDWTHMPVVMGLNNPVFYGKRREHDLHRLKYSFIISVKEAMGGDASAERKKRKEKKKVRICPIQKAAQLGRRKKLARLEGSLCHIHKFETSTLIQRLYIRTLLYLYCRQQRAVVYCKVANSDVCNCVDPQAMMDN